MDEAVNDMLDKGIISPTVSPSNSSIVPIKKKNNKIRFCIDKRSLNAVMTFCSIFPLPDTKDALDHLERCVIRLQCCEQCNLIIPKKEET